MGRDTISDSGHGPTPSPSTAEAAAEAYFVGRGSAGDYCPRPPIEKWRPDQRKRFEAELARLERDWADKRRDRLEQLEAESP